MLEGIRRIYFLGLEQPGTSGLARLLRERGFDVCGSAERENTIVGGLRADGIAVDVGVRRDGLKGGDLVVTTRTSDEDEPALVWAAAEGVPCVGREALLQATTEAHRTIGVAGTHGKGSVAGMIAWVLEAAGWGPGFIIGGLVKNFAASARQGEGRWMVVELEDLEACAGVLKLDYVVCNFLEAEKEGEKEAEQASLEELIDSMQRFLESNERLKEAFVNLDCSGNRRLVEHLAMRPTGYGIEHLTEFRGEITGVAGGGVGMLVHRREDVMGPVELSVPGDYQLVNALAAFAVTRRMGVDPEIIAHALGTYEGVAARFDVVRGGGVTVIKDGATKATKIRRVLKSAREMVEGRLIAVVDFAPSKGGLFEGVSEVIHLRRDEDAAPEVFIEELAAMGGVAYRECPDPELVSSRLLEILEPDDGVAFLGGDEAFALADRVGAELARRAGRAEPGPQQRRMDGPLTE